MNSYLEGRCINSIDRWMDGWMDGRTGGWADGRMDPHNRVH